MSEAFFTTRPTAAASTWPLCATAVSSNKCSGLVQDCGCVEASVLVHDGVGAALLVHDVVEAAVFVHDGVGAAVLVLDVVGAAVLVHDGVEGAVLVHDGVGAALLVHDGVEAAVLVHDGVGVAYACDSLHLVLVCLVQYHQS